MRLGLCFLALALGGNGYARELKCSEALLRLWNQGPNKWVATGASPKGEFGFVRGIGAKPHEGFEAEPSGAKDALKFLEGASFPHSQYVWPLEELEKLKTNPTYDGRLGSYASPLSVAGRVDRLEDFDKLGDTPVAVVPAGELSIEAIQSLAIVLPHARGIAQIRWTQDYLKLTEELEKAGTLKWVPGSRGHRFYLELKEAYRQLFETEHDRYNVPVLQEVFERYETP